MILRDLTEQLRKTLMDLEARLRPTVSQASSVDDSARLLKKARQVAADVLKHADSLHEALFFPLGIEDMKNGVPCRLTEQLERLCSEQGTGMRWCKPDVVDSERQVAALKKPNLREAHAMWDWDVVTAVSALLANVARGSRYIGIPRDWGADAGEAIGWARLRLEERRLAIELANYAHEPLRTIDEKTKNKHFRVNLQALGGDVSYAKDDTVLITTIRIPYAHTLISADLDNRS